MSEVPIKFRRSSEGMIASYSFSEIASGIGVVVFYGASTENSSGTTYFLSENVTYTDEPIATGGSATSADFTKVADLDFDLQAFNLPTRIKGKMRVVATLCVTGSTNYTESGYLIYKFRKWDGTTETEIANAQTPTLTSAAATVGSITHNTEIDITTQQHFKKGEVMRLTVECWAKQASGSGAPFDGFVGVAHDPKDRNDAALLNDGDTSVMEVLVPFLIDL